MITKRKVFIRMVLCCFVLSLLVQLFADEFDVLEFSSPVKYGWANEQMRLAARDSLFIKNLHLDKYNQLRQNPLNNVMKTAIAPGWGHFSVGSNTKGQVFLASQIALLSTGIYFHQKSMIEYRKYKKATQIDEMNQYYDSAITPYRQANLLFGLFFAVWCYTIYDVVLETNSYNADVWEDIVNNRLKVTPSGVSIEF